MTRKNALKLAIKIVENSSVDSETKGLVIEKLELCISELPFARWSREAIFDACDQFIEDHNRPLTLSDFSSAQLPSHPTIKNRFGMTLKKFRDTYYPLPPKTYGSRYAGQEAQYIIQRFKDEYVRCGARTREDYDNLRDKSHPCSATILKRLGMIPWDGLLELASVSRPSRQKKLVSYCTTFTTAYDKSLLKDRQN